MELTHLMSKPLCGNASLITSYKLCIELWVGILVLQKIKAAWKGMATNLCIKEE
jgi:hypothetical protein